MDVPFRVEQATVSTSLHVGQLQVSLLNPTYYKKKLLC